MDFQAIVVVFKESLLFFFRLLPYLVIGIFLGAVLEVALSRYKEIDWLKRPGIMTYMIVSLVGIGTPL